MKVLKIIGIIVLVLVAIVVIAGLIAPKDFDVKRDIVVNAPEDVVFKNISSLQAFNKWNPWAKLDPNQTVRDSGVDGTVGSSHYWKGNDSVGEGQMTLTKVEANKGVEYDLHFMKPFESHNTAYMNMEKAEGGYKVTWGMKGHMPFPFNAMGLFMNMDKQVGKDFEAGLATLKSMCESTPVSATTYEIKETEWPETNALSIRQVVKFQDMTSFFGTNYPKMDGVIKKAGAKGGIPIAVYYKYDEEKGEADVAAAIPVDAKKDFGKEFTLINLPAGKAYLIDYYGDYNNMKAPYDAMAKFLQDNFKRDDPDMVVEQYITDPMTEKDPAKWHTAIYFFVKNEVAAK